LSDTTTIGDYDINSNCKKNTLIIVDSDCEVDSKPTRLYNYNNKDYSDSNTTYNSNSDNDSNTTYNNSDNSGSNLSLRKNVDKNCNIDNKCTAESEETRSFLYRHFTIYIVLSSTLGKSNTIFTKITLLYTKDEDNVTTLARYSRYIFYRVVCSI